ncbi:unnamed protein product [Amoebophrya sp. A120]|nr:unnamed protein product [Amoebophrya sp. A120]|eukprot:GSA120T00010739001.1
MSFVSQVVVFVPASACSSSSHRPNLFKLSRAHHRFAPGWQGGGKNRFSRFRDRANKLHVDYIRQLGPKLEQKSPQMLNPSGGQYDKTLKTAHQRANERFGIHFEPGDVAGHGHGGAESVCTTTGGTSSGGSSSSSSATSSSSTGAQCSTATETNQSTNMFADALRGPRYRGKIAEFELPGFGSVEVHHGDLFRYRKDAGDRGKRGFSAFADEQAPTSFAGTSTGSGASSSSSSRPGGSSSSSSARTNSSTTTSWLVPMIPNFLPSRGFSLDVLESIGEEKVKDVFRESRRILEKRNRTYFEQASPQLDIGDVVTVPTAPSTSGHASAWRFGEDEHDLAEQELLGGGSNESSSSTESHFDCSDDTPALHELCDRLSFLITPYFWQGSALDAAQRLRHCVKQGLRKTLAFDKSALLTEEEERASTSSSATASFGSTMSWLPGQSSRIAAEDSFRSRSFGEGKELYESRNVVAGHSGSSLRAVPATVPSTTSSKKPLQKSKATLRFFSTSTSGAGATKNAISNETFPLGRDRHTIIMQHLGMGLYGYEPRDSARILLEEAVEAVLRNDEYRFGDVVATSSRSPSNSGSSSTSAAPTATRPSADHQPPSTLDSRQITIKLIEKDFATCEILRDELVKLEQRYLPERRPITARKFYQQMFKRLIALPEQPSQFLRQHRVTFPLRHGIIRNRRHWYIRHMRPFLWRAQKVNVPPPLIVESGTGHVASAKQQRPARPHYDHGISHDLFPTAKTGLHALRRSQTTGALIGKLEQYKLREDAHTSVVPGDGRCGRRWGKKKSGSF